MKVKQTKRWMVGGAVARRHALRRARGSGRLPAERHHGDHGRRRWCVRLPPPRPRRPRRRRRRVATLAATGSDSDTTLKLAGGALVAGAGLLVAAKMRRRPVAA